MPDRTKLRILIVDDQRSIRSLVCSSLHQLGCRDIVECSDGEEALKECVSRPVDLVISDLNMPKVDGLALLRAIRGTQGLEKTPFIMLTSRAEVGMVKQAIDLKVNNYLVKPFTFDGLRSKIEAVVGPLR